MMIIICLIMIYIFITVILYVLESDYNIVDDILFTTISQISNSMHMLKVHICANYQFSIFLLWPFIVMLCVGFKIGKLITWIYAKGNKTNIFLAKLNDGNSKNQQITASNY